LTSHVFAETTHSALPPPKLWCRVGSWTSQTCEVLSNSVKGFQLPWGSKSAFSYA